MTLTSYLNGLIINMSRTVHSQMVIEKSEVFVDIIKV